jgi:hypothetical protein
VPVRGQGEGEGVGRAFSRAAEDRSHSDLTPAVAAATSAAATTTHSRRRLELRRRADVVPVVARAWLQEQSLIRSERDAQREKDGEKERQRERERKHAYHGLHSLHLRGERSSRAAGCEAARQACPPPWADVSLLRATACESKERDREMKKEIEKERLHQ